MSASNSDTTRLLCASAFINGNSFCNSVLTYLKDPIRAIAPELGVDMQLVAKACVFAKRRESRLLALICICLIFALGTAIIDFTLAAVVLVLSTGVVYFVSERGKARILRDSFRKSLYSPAAVDKIFGVDLRSEIASSLPEKEQNLFVYKGFTPFVGAGVDLGGWSFTVDVSKACEDYGRESIPKKFTVSELNEGLHSAILASELEGLKIADSFYVAGQEIREDSDILPDIFSKPVQFLQLNRSAAYIEKNDPRIRHYKWIRVHDWDQELITSYFLRCSLRGNSLYVEISRYLLTPLADQYRRADKLAPPSASRTVLMLLGSFIVGPVYALIAPFLLFARAKHALKEEFGTERRNLHNQIKENPAFNYGAGQGLRQSFSSNQFEHYFQRSDGNFYIKVLERVILDSIVGFLEEHDIDTSELRDRQSTILNSGIIIHGGDVKAESLAVGVGAQAVKSTQRREKRGTKGAAA